MRYRGKWFVEDPAGRFRWKKKNAGPWIYGSRYGSPDPPGFHFCTSPEGTGRNADGKRCGNATKGNCLAQFQVNDMK